MALQAGMAMANGRWARADTLGRVHLAAVAAYGKRVRRTHGCQEMNSSVV